MNDLKKQVLISVLTVQRDDEGKSKINSEYKGTMYLKNGVFFVFYTEYSEENEKIADCRIKCSPDTVEIKRSGAYSSNLSFKTGTTYKSVYSTPYGSMPVSVKTKKMITALDIQGGKIVIDYKMSIGGNDFENNVSISIRPE